MPVRATSTVRHGTAFDVGGNEWRSGQFWSDVFDEVHRNHAPTEARSIITKIRDAVVAFINKLIRATPKQGFQYGYTREELAEIRDNPSRQRQSRSGVPSG